MRVLIVDDEAEIRNVVKLLLESKGYEVAEAKNGSEAVDAVRADSEIDLCIMDIMMPRKSGISAVSEIREFSTVPILFLTANLLTAIRRERTVSAVTTISSSPTPRASL